MDKNTATLARWKGMRRVFLEQEYFLQTIVVTHITCARVNIFDHYEITVG
jgi:hypothetical protein